MKTPALPHIPPLCGMVLAVLLAACGRLAVTPTPTPDIPALETRVAIKLEGTLTAKAPPTWTPSATAVPPTATATVATASPTLTSTPTATPTGGPEERSVRLAYVRLGQDRAANVVLHAGDGSEDVVLTHFVEPLNMSDVTWSRDGQWILFVSAHEFVHSRANERNVFMVRPDGTELHMVTGDYVDPDEAPGPYTTLRGKVVNGQGDCLVSAQGVASPVLAGADGVFTLPGVPLSAIWARAICQTDGVPLQGDVDLEATADALVPVGIPVEPQGGGWTQVSLSRDGTLLAGTCYRWCLDAEGAKTYVMSGTIADLEGRVLAEAQLPEDTTLMGLDWSPIDDTLVGGLTGEDGAWLWRWDARGGSVGAIVEIPNTEQALLAAVNPVWSPDGSRIAFGLRQWHLWEENKSRTELAVYRLDEKEPRVVGPADWGRDVDSASWAGDGDTVYYEISDRAAGDETWTKANGRIWLVSTAEEAPTPTPWPGDEERYLPAADPSS
jgi:dipeptidyl aminopeptidase/acylaminoacyl peptidase